MLCVTPTACNHSVGSDQTNRNRQSQRRFLAESPYAIRIVGSGIGLGGQEQACTLLVVFRTLIPAIKDLF